MRHGTSSWRRLSPHHRRVVPSASSHVPLAFPLWHSHDALANIADVTRTALAAFKRSGTRLACLCGSDDAYAREGENAAKALRAAGASRIYLVGEPGTREGQLRAAGVDAFIFAGCDALSILRAAHGVDASIR